MFDSTWCLNENNELKNRYLHIEWKEKVDIKDLNLSNVMLKNITKLYKELINNEYFGRNDVVNILNMSCSGVSKLIFNMLKNEIIVIVNGYGKGKYNFNSNININMH